MKSLRKVLLGCLLAALVAALAPPSRIEASAEGKKALEALIAQAKQEGELTTQIVRQAGTTAPTLVAAFKKRFGLDNLKANIKRGGQSEAFVQMFIAVRAGGKPPYDTYPGSGDNQTELIEGGFAEKVDSWKALLAEINPLVRSGEVKPEEVSPYPFTGYAFMWGGRNKVLIYNTNLIKQEELPQSRADMANPRYKDRFVLGPWSTEWEIGLLSHPDKAGWINTLQSIGKNSAGVMHTTQAHSRLLLGEFAFFPGNLYQYLNAKARDKDAPVGYHFFTDGTATSRIFYSLPKNARHPATGTLFALWMGTPEAEAIWQPPSFYSNVAWGSSDIDKTARTALKKSGSKLLSFFDNQKSLELLRWFGTEEGTEYRGSITKAIRQRH